MCEAQAAGCVNKVLAAGWLDMAADWRAMAADGNAQATTARLMSLGRTTS